MINIIPHLLPINLLITLVMWTSYNNELQNKWKKKKNQSKKIQNHLQKLHKLSSTADLRPYCALNTLMHLVQSTLLPYNALNSQNILYCFKQVIIFPQNCIGCENTKIMYYFGLVWMKQCMVVVSTLIHVIAKFWNV